MVRVSDIIAELLEILATEGNIGIYLQDDKARLSPLKRGDFNVQTVAVGLNKYESAVLLHVE